MDTIYVVISIGDSDGKIEAAFSNEIDAQKEVIRLIQRTEDFYCYRAVEWRG